MAINIRFKGIIGTLAAIAADKFSGRVAWATDIARMIWYYDATNYGIMARRDVLESFEAGIQDATVTAGQPMVAGASGRYQTQDAATFRATIGAAGASNTVTREMIIQPLPITNSDPDVVTFVSGSMRSFGFDGGTLEEELFYHVDLQHDYIAGTDIVLHVHWAPATNSGGDVVFRWDYQWTEAGGTWGAPTATACAAVAAGATAWADKRSEVTISGAGHTYNSCLLLRLYRTPTGTDTYAGDAVLSSVGVHYSANPLQA
jgi:hypothetical protein